MKLTVIATLITIFSATCMGQAVTDLYEAADYDGLRYRLLKPAVPAPGKKYPVVLFLHGAGERGNDNAAQLKYFPTWMAAEPMRSDYPAFVIAPQCPPGKRWGSLDWSKKSYDYAQDPVAEMVKVQHILMKVLENPAADPNRVYLTGLSMGGFGSWELASRDPETFAAVVPICGGGDISHAHKLVGIPLWAFHGGADKVVKPELSRQMIDAIKQAGGHPKYTELPGVGHDSWTPAYQNAELMKWLFSQVRKAE
jgi:predicted peptidase